MVLFRDFLFNPLHAGHIEYIQAAANECNCLVVIINNDKQVKLKGSTPFMDEKHREIIVSSLRSVFMTMIAIDEDSTVAKTLALLKKSFLPGEHKIIFFNSGDRNPNNINIAEEEACKILEIETKFLDLPKIYSSSELKKK